MLGDMCNLPQLLTTQDVARLLRMSPSSVLVLRKQGQLHAIRPGGEHGPWKFLPDSVRSYLCSFGYRPQERQKSPEALEREKDRFRVECERRHRAAQVRLGYARRGERQHA